jgi:hypothetical protein
MAPTLLDYFEDAKKTKIDKFKLLLSNISMQGILQIMQLNKDNAKQFLDLFIDTSNNNLYGFNNAEFKHSNSRIVNFFSEVFLKKPESTIVKTLESFDFKNI